MFGYYMAKWKDLNYLFQELVQAENSKKFQVITFKYSGRTFSLL
jgi:hypothetical protein